jgi:hypothetical protein
MSTTSAASKRKRAEAKASGSKAPAPPAAAAAAAAAAAKPPRNEDEDEKTIDPIDEHTEEDTESGAKRQKTSDETIDEEYLLSQAPEDIHKSPVRAPQQKPAAAAASVPSTPIRGKSPAPQVHSAPAAAVVAAAAAAVPSSMMMDHKTTRSASVARVISQSQFTRTAGEVPSQFSKPAAAAASASTALIPAARANNTGMVLRNGTYKDSSQFDANELNMSLVPVTEDDQKNTIFISSMTEKQVLETAKCFTSTFKGNTTFKLGDKRFGGRAFHARSPFMSMFMYHTVPSGNMPTGMEKTKSKYPPASPFEAKWSAMMSIRAFGPQVDAYGCDPDAVKFMRFYTLLNRFYLSQAAVSDPLVRDHYLTYCFERMGETDHLIKNKKKEEKLKLFEKVPEDQKQKWVQGWIDNRCHFAFSRGDDGDGGERVKFPYTRVEFEPHPDLRLTLNGYVLDRFAPNPFEGATTDEEKKRVQAKEEAKLKEDAIALELRIDQAPTEERKSLLRSSAGLYQYTKKWALELLPKWNAARAANGEEEAKYVLPAKLPFFTRDGTDGNEWRELEYLEQSNLTRNNNYLTSCEFVFKVRKPTPPGQTSAVVLPGLVIELNKGWIARQNMAGSGYYDQKVAMPSEAQPFALSSDFAHLSNEASVKMREMAKLQIVLPKKGASNK